MKRALGKSGYTILEVMIVLVISGGLLTAVAAMISGQQQRTEFQTATREMESKLQDIFNDVESGVFPTANTITSCKENNTTLTYPDIKKSGIEQEQGTNKGCVLLGKAIQFDDEDGLKNKYDTMFIVGNRHTQDFTDALTIADAHPTGLFVNDPTFNNSVDTSYIPNGIQLSKILYYKPNSAPDAPPIPDGSGSDYIGFVSAIGAGATRAGTDSAATNADGGARIARINFLNTSHDLAGLNLKIQGITAADLSTPVGAVLCLNDGGGSNPRISAIAIGLKLDSSNAIQADGQRTSTSAYFDADARNMGC